MKKTLFLTAALLLATVSGQGAVTLLDGFTPTTQSTGNSQANWTGGESSLSEGWAISFKTTLPTNLSTLGNTDAFFSTNKDSNGPTGWIFAIANKSSSGVTLSMKDKITGQANSAFTTTEILKEDLLNNPLTLVVRKVSDTSSSVTFYLGGEEIASGTSNTLMSLTKNEARFWSNSGRTKLSDIQGVTFDASDSNTDVLAALGIVSVPEPATASLGILGLAALMIRRRRA